MEARMSMAQALLAARASDETLRERAYSSETAEGLDLTGLDLADVRFAGCRFTACDFSRAGFVDVAFERCAFVECRFMEAYFRRACFDGCKAEGANFAAARLHETALVSASFRYANFTGGVWERCRTTAPSCAAHPSARFRRRRSCACSASGSFEPPSAHARPAASDDHAGLHPRHCAQPLGTRARRHCFLSRAISTAGRSGSVR